MGRYLVLMPRALGAVGRPLHWLQHTAHPTPLVLPVTAVPQVARLCWALVPWNVLLFPAVPEGG